MARLIEAGEDPRPTVEHMLTRSSVVTGAMMCTLIGATPALIPAVFDPEWNGIVDVLPWACAGLLISGPISVSVAGFLFAQGDARTALRAAIIHSAAALVIGIALLPVIGDTALGLAIFAASLIDGVVLGTRSARGYQIRFLRALLVPTSVAVAAAAGGWAIAELVRPDVAGAIAGGTVALAGFLGGVALLSPSALRDTIGMASRALRPSPAS
jgi:O-antigen/teichoic acid export membrane protein